MKSTKPMNYENFYPVFVKAIGNRTCYLFWKESGIPESTLSRILNNKRNGIDIETLYRISEHAHNGITFKDLCLAYGYNEEEIPQLLEVLNNRETYKTNKEYREFVNDKDNFKYILALIEAKKQGFIDKLMELFNMFK